MSSLCVCRLPVCSCVEDTSIHQQEMIKACETGDVSRLQNLLDATGVRKGDSATQRTTDPIYLSGPPATSDMLHMAVHHNQPAILRLLLETYPSASVAEETLLGSECANPDLPTFKVLHSHDPSIVNFTLDEKGLETLLMDYCRSGNPQLPEYLLDNGADPDWAGPPLPLSPLPRAIISDQPPSLISNMIERGAHVRSIDVMCAMHQQRTDITAMLLRNCWWDANAMPEEFLESALEEAYLTKDKEIISLMEKNFNIGKARRKWWQIWK